LNCFHLNVCIFSSTSVIRQATALPPAKPTPPAPSRKSIGMNSSCYSKFSLLIFILNVQINADMLEEIESELKAKARRNSFTSSVTSPPKRNPMNPFQSVTQKAVLLEDPQLSPPRSILKQPSPQHNSSKDAPSQPAAVPIVNEFFERL
jgi:hypothetical protein